MPCVKTIDSIRICIYSRDHNPPHFHVLIAEYEELIRIEDFENYSDPIPTKYRKKVIEWAVLNQGFLWTNWKLLNKKNESCKKNT
jgi:beta-glucosidase/6-phospho-beta-glucosidase/beta-galactosidase